MNIDLSSRISSIVLTVYWFSLLYFQVWISYASSQNVTDIRCRTERGILLSLEAYKIDTCARCYTYLPQFAFVSKEKRLRYDFRSGLLYDVIRNVSVVADHDNTTHPIYDSFQSDLFARKWIHCCKAAVECCHKMHADPLPSKEEIVCPRTWDGWQCWSDTPAGETAENPCQDHVYFMSEPPPCPRYAMKKCWSNGTWYINQWNNEWSNYSGCGRVEGIRRLQIFHVSTYAVSIIFLLPALFIFSTYNGKFNINSLKPVDKKTCQLQVHRITMHKNLFAALLINAALAISFKAVVILDEMDHADNRRTILEDNKAGCKILFVLTKYTRMCTYMWMFCEGFYLHKLIAAAFAEQKSLKVFYFIGWVFPIFPVGTFALLRWLFADEQCWAVPVQPYEWVTNSLNVLSLLLNFAFLCNIIRVLVTKLRATHANEPSQFRKAVRATLVLVPLFGLHFFLFIYRPQSGECTLLEGYSFFSYAMDGLQGLLVSLIFCYLNGEVMDLIRRSLYRYRLRYSVNVPPNSIMTTVSDVSSGGRSRQSSECCSSTEWKSRRSRQASFSQNKEMEMDAIAVVNHLHRNDSKNLSETSFLMQK